MTLKEIQLKLYEKLKPSGWGDKLKMFLLSDEFTQILEHLYKNSQADKKFTPILKDLFRAFEECPYDKLSVIIIGQDPYPTAGVADGISFSCAHTQKEQPSLKYIFDEIERTVYSPNIPQDESIILREGYNPDLKRWANQGILMLNTALTCEIGEIGSHIELWKPFTTHLMDVLNTYNTGMIYLFLGNAAKEWHKHISTQNYKLFTTHPASAAYRKNKNWDSGNVFNQINKIMNDQYGEQIVW